MVLNLFNRIATLHLFTDEKVKAPFVHLDIEAGIGGGLFKDHQFGILLCSYCGYEWVPEYIYPKKCPSCAKESDGNIVNVSFKTQVISVIKKGSKCSLCEEEHDRLFNLYKSDGIHSVCLWCLEHSEDYTESEPKKMGQSHLI